MRRIPALVVCVFAAGVGIAQPATAQSPAGCVYNEGSAFPGGAPVVTHWNGTAPQYGATAQPLMGASYPFQYGSPSIFPLPWADNHVTEIYSNSAVASGSIDVLLSSYCNASTGVPYRFYNASDPNLVAYLLAETPVPGWNRPGTGRTRIVHGFMLYESFVTLILPPNFDARTLIGTAPAATRHPIVAQGFYDVNDNLFSGFGNANTIAQIVAESGLGVRAGAVGLIWNGGASKGSVTGSAADRSHFNSIINWIYNNANGDRSKLYMLGRSRGASSALLMASNPDPHQYTVKYVSVVAPGVRFGEHSELIGATIPGQLDTLGQATGLVDAWRPGWLYPSGGRPELLGKDGRTATRHVLFGPSFESWPYLDAAGSLVSSSFISALAAAQTRVLLVAGSHDEFIPYGQQSEYINQLQGAGVPIEAHVILRGGHLYDDVLSVYSGRFRQAVIGDLDGGNVGVTNGTWYYRQEPNGAITAIAPATFPFTLQVPYALYAGMPLHLFATGPTGLQYELYTSLGAVGGTIQPGRLFDVITVDSSAMGGLTVAFTLVRFRLSPAHPWTNLNVNKVTGCGPHTSPLTISVHAGPPPITDGFTLYQALRVPASIRCGEIGWGLSEFEP